MSKAFRQVKRLRRLTFDELRVRGNQAGLAFAERHGWTSLATMPTAAGLLAMLDPDCRISPVDQLLSHFQSRRQPRFFASFRDKDATIAELRRRWPGAEAEILSRADRILRGSFDLLGFEKLSFGEPIDWHLEPLSRKRAPRIHWSRLDQLDVTAGDKKIVWELNRHQYFITLGQAYWLTGDEQYTSTFLSHLESWMDENPPKLGLNWSSSLEIAFRSISWLWAFHFFRESKCITSSSFLRALKYLYLNARHLESYLSTYSSPNTHLTGEALGLFYLGTLLPELKEASRWREAALRILRDQLMVQVKPDGVYFEQSSYYQRYTTDFYIHLLLLLKENDQEVPPELEGKLRTLLDHLMYISRPDGTWPLFGDDDGGRLLPLHPRPANDFRATLSTGAILFGGADYKFVAGLAEETLWLVGPEQVQMLERITAQLPEHSSVAFPQGGYYVFRDGWTSNSNYLLFDCGSHGALNCGHAHADALSFELAVSGRTILIDPGTYSYTGASELRDWFRSSFAHNTVTVDGESSSIPAGPFSWKTVARCQLEHWISRGRFDYVAGHHDGYMRLRDPVLHRRSILFLKRDYWIVKDRLQARMQHRADVWFHFDSGTNPLIEAPDSTRALLAERDGDTGLDIQCFGNGHWRREDRWVSHCYGQREESRVYAFSAQFQGETDFITFLLPRNVTTHLRVREIEAIGGQAFEITHENGLDIVMIRAGERVESPVLRSDFAWTWARFSSATDTRPVELLLLDGTTLEVSGRQIMKSECSIPVLVATSVGDQFRVETDGGVRNVRWPFSGDSVSAELGQSW